MWRIAVRVRQRVIFDLSQLTIILNNTKFRGVGNGGSMYVCICNAITDQQIERAISDGHVTADAVYQACGVAPQCGTCSEQITEMIEGKIAAHFEAASENQYAAA